MKMATMPRSREILRMCNVTCRKEIAEFIPAMEEKLHRDDAKKPHWSEESMLDLRMGILDETTELFDELDEGNVEAAMKECADVANYAMMIFDNLRTMGKEAM